MDMPASTPHPKSMRHLYGAFSHKREGLQNAESLPFLHFGDTRNRDCGKGLRRVGRVDTDRRH